ncbi:PREDICTED: RING finger protein 37 isoform X2 [Cyprinodon variegatus]|uniref:RING finger protein 37 isoform X2 n=1 Tax=Cyprinodon variegatus TaxID=28743 RepID=UPI000742B159|nr:PREDICTED: RING finger protein 37 isoform X2 [Cyprinodon variegatus]
MINVLPIYLRLENMVFNLCLPHFSTTAHCNKLCADGYDVTNIVSADPALRKRGFKLEYFLRPPLHVTLKFGFPVELCRVDVELWPLGMDRGQACRRLEISTSSDTPTLSSRVPVHRQDQSKRQKKEQNITNRQKHRHVISNGHQWSVQAQQWGTEAQDRPQHTDFQSQLNSESSCSESEFKLVARCELREETLVSFSHSNFRARAPFLSPAPLQSAACRQEKLWSRGLPSLGAVTQLRVAVPFSGAASSLGLKALAVWGQPARCCPTEEVERIERTHKANERRVEPPAFFAPPIGQTRQTLQGNLSSGSISIPDEFLDPLTQEVMMLPMLLPSGMSVDTSTLEEYQKREATWGRQPNDPFTGVPFSSTCQPLPNPELKSRIDRFLLEKGVVGREGALGGQDKGQNPQASRLVTSNGQRHSQSSPGFIKAPVNTNSTQFTTKIGGTSQTSAEMANTDSGPSSTNRDEKPNTHILSKDNNSLLKRAKKRDRSEISSGDSTTEKQLLPQSKNIRNNSGIELNVSSHEQLLSASLDEALFSALQGRPSFTSNLLHHGESTSQSTICQSSGFTSSSTDGKVCSQCSSSVSIYSPSASSIYRLICGHLLCRACVQKETKPLNSANISSHILCPSCQSPTPRCNITRVHH